jgi:tripartite-type tricarboxylate transporter receptor subunit TctC
MSIRLKLSALVGVSFAAAVAWQGAAFAQTPFYQGKVITMVVGYTTGGLYDTTTRLVARHIPKHLAGTPTVIVQNMPGAGGTKALMHLYSVAPKDGTVFGMVKRSYATDPMFESDAPDYDPNKIQPIGSTSSETSIVATWHTSKAKTFEDIFKNEITVGATGSTDGTVRYAQLVKRLTPAKLKIVSGYPGGNDVTLAVERGEVDSKFGWSWGSVKSRAKNWLDEKKINIILQMGLKKADDLPNVPFIMDYAKTDLDKQALELVFAPTAFAWPIVAGPGVPAERIAQLRKAFDDTMKDPEFLADAKKLEIEIDPITGEEMAKVVARLVTFDKAAIARAVELTKPE